MHCCFVLWKYTQKSNSISIFSIRISEQFACVKIVFSNLPWLLRMNIFIELFIIHWIPMTFDFRMNKYLVCSVFVFCILIMIIWCWKMDDIILLGLSPSSVCSPWLKCLSHSKAGDEGKQTQMLNVIHIKYRDDFFVVCFKSSCGFLKYWNHCSSLRNFHCLFEKKLACLPLLQNVNLHWISLNKNGELEALLSTTYSEFDLFSRWKTILNFVAILNVKII